MRIITESVHKGLLLISKTETFTQKNTGLLLMMAVIFSSLLIIRCSSGPSPC